MSKLISKSKKVVNNAPRGFEGVRPRREKPAHFGKRKPKRISVKKDESEVDEGKSRSISQIKTSGKIDKFEQKTVRPDFDPAKKKRRAENSQNFLKNPSLGAFLVKNAGIKAGEKVLEIGPGGGVLTEALLKVGATVLSVEKDVELARELRRKYGSEPKLEVVNTDFLSFKNNWEAYKVFANPPFAISSALVKRLVFIPNQPSEIHLFLQKEFANRLLARHYETQLSVLVKTFYYLQITHQFKGTDFSPVPGVMVVMVQFKKHREQLISADDMALYIKFVMYGFQAQKSTLEKNFKKIFTHEQWKKIAVASGFNIKAQPAELNSRQWVELFKIFNSSMVAVEKKALVIKFEPKE